MVKVKICGITNLEDAIAACEYGADALGFVFYEKSPRYISPAHAISIVKELPPFITKVGVFVNEAVEKMKDIKKITGLDAIQLHGDETPEMCELLGNRIVKAFRISRGEAPSPRQFSKYNVSAFLLDTHHDGLHGGTGKTFDWNIAVGLKKYGRIVLSGGLTPENVAEAIKKVRPYAIDVSSGVEERPGKKDLKKVRKFIEKTRSL